MKRAELVFLPTPGTGHLVSTFKFATQLLDRDPRFSITIFLVTNPYEAGNSLPPSNTDRLRFLRLPPVEPPPLELLPKSLEKFSYIWMERHKPIVRDAIVNHVFCSPADSPPIVALVLDLFFSMMIDVGKQLGLPSYIFFTSGAAFYGFMSFLGNQHQENQDAVVFREESDNDVSINTIPCFLHPVPTTVFPSFAFNKEGGYNSMVEHALKFKEANGVIINTFLELESHAVNSLLEDHENPPIYTGGPIIDFKSEYRPTSNENRSKEIMAWLDEQPPSSVVFLCFGSMGFFSATQIKEIANGLENSGKRFLWCLRRSPEENKIGTRDYDDFKDVLGDGFLEWTEGKGIVCGWVKQEDVLGHKAIGGFVSHCGWNSLLESIWYGVPIVAWPLYAEQQINAFEFVMELGLAVEMKIDYRRDGGDLVSADEIERVVRSVMESGGDQVRERVMEVSRKSREAVMEGGSSHRSIGLWIDDVLSQSM